MALDTLPKDSWMLLSYVNTRLRDDGVSLDELVKELGVEKEYIVSALNELDYHYNEELNRFV